MWDVHVLIEQTPLGISRLSQLWAILVLGDSEFMSVEHFILFKVLYSLCLVHLSKLGVT